MHKASNSFHVFLISPVCKWGRGGFLIQLTSNYSESNMAPKSLSFQGAGLLPRSPGKAPKSQDANLFLQNIRLLLWTPSYILPFCREPHWEHLKLLFFFIFSHRPKKKKKKKKERMLRESLWWYKQVCTSKHTQFKQLLRLWDEMYYRCAHRRHVSNWWRQPFDKQEERTDNLLSLPSSSVTHATPHTNISIRAALLKL